MKILAGEKYTGRYRNKQTKKICRLINMKDKRNDT